jgi:cell division protein FtsL
MARTVQAPAADALGFAVRKNIRNEPRREVDHAGQRRMWSVTVSILLFLAVSIGSIWLRNEQIRLGYEIEQLQAERARAESERRHLLVELEALRSPQRLEMLGLTELRMVSPSHTDAFVIERVRTSPPPAGTTVASR